MARLEAWLAGPPPISARCLIGRAGTGKTRLALQLCERAEALTPAWDAGFAKHRELERFASLQNLSAWGWRRPTLIVVDYAAGITRWLRPWLEEVARNPDCGDGARLRLLMLERFADPGIGWWAELTRTGWSDAALSDLFDPPQPERLPPIGAPERTALARAVMRRALPDMTGGSDADAACRTWPAARMPMPRACNTWLNRRMARPRRWMRSWRASPWRRHPASRGSVGPLRVSRWPAPSPVMNASVFSLLGGLG